MKYIMKCNRNLKRSNNFVKYRKNAVKYNI